MSGPDTSHTDTLHDKRPEHILSLRFIPPNMAAALPAHIRPGPVSMNQKSKIRAILRMKKGQAWNRCRGKSAKKAKALAKQGDPSHLPMSHTSCELCQCEHSAGLGTKGDFYGLGPETGTLGAGFCRKCIKELQIRPMFAMKSAQRDVDAMQRYNTVNAEKGYLEKVAREEVALARQSTRMRKELQVLDDTLSETLALIDREKKAESKAAADIRAVAEWIEKNADTDEAAVARVLEMAEAALLNETTLTRYVGTKLVPMSFEDKANLKIKAARAKTKDAIDGIKLDATKVVHIENMMQWADEVNKAAESMSIQQDELYARQAAGEEIETDMTVREYVWGIYKDRYRAAGERLKKREAAMDK